MELADKPDWARFILRITFGTMFLIDGFQYTKQVMNDKSGILYIVFTIIVFLCAPLATTVGFFTRFFSLIVVIGCLFNISTQGVIIETGYWSPMFIYLFIYLAMLFLGSGNLLAFRPD